MKKSNAAVKSEVPAIAGNVLASGEFGIHLIAEIRISPDNRKRFNEVALQELAESIKSMGVAQPILIRPVTPTAELPERFEIVAGERRYRASKIAGMPTIPAMVRELSDVDAAKIRILENLQRENPHPLEEAEGYEQLMMKHGYSADQLVDEIKKSRAYVYGRLKLCALTSLVREQFLLDRISASTALLIARIAVPNLQYQAYKEIVREGNSMMGAMSHREAANHIQSRYMLDLTQAPFQMSDAKLLTAAGSCVKCPKRTGNQPDVFADLGADVCTDPDCFAEKRGAVAARLIVEANKKGIPVLDGDDEVDTFMESGEFDKGSAYVNTVGGIPRDNGHWYSPVDRVLDPKDMPPVKAYIKDGAKLVAVYETEALEIALQKAGICESEEARQQRIAEQAKSPEAIKRAAEADANTAKQTAAAEQARLETDYRVSLYKKLRSHGEVQGFAVQSLRELVKMMLHQQPLPHDILSDVYNFDTTSDESVCAHIDQAGLPEIQLLLVDLVVGEALSVDKWAVRNGSISDDAFTHVAAMCEAEGIDAALMRETIMPTALNVDTLQYDDLVRIIKATPQRINELSKAVLAGGVLIGALERAANDLGFTYGTAGWVSKGQPAHADEAAGTLDGMVGNDRAASLVDDAEQAQAEPASTDDVDATQLAEQMLEDAAKPAPTTRTKGKGVGKLSPAAAWPFPKTSAEALGDVATDTAAV